MKIEINLLVDSDVSISDYFDSKTIYSLISLSDFTNNKEGFDRRIPQSSESSRERDVTFSNPLVKSVFIFFLKCLSLILLKMIWNKLEDACILKKKKTTRDFKVLLTEKKSNNEKSTDRTSDLLCIPILIYTIFRGHRRVYSLPNVKF